LCAHKRKQNGAVFLSGGLAQPCLHILRIADTFPLVLDPGFPGQFGIQGWRLWELFEEDGPVSTCHYGVLNVMVHQVIEDMQAVF
jgi:hypothetical protein